MEFKKIREAVLLEVHNRHDLDNPIKTQEDLNELMQRNGKQYKGDFKTQFIKMSRFIGLKRAKDIKEEFDLIESIENAENFKDNLVITVEWNKSRMWGSNPRAESNKGFRGSSIGGCGYDKHSTAVAEALNDDLGLMKLLYIRKEKELNNLKESYTEQNGFKGNSQQHINAEIFGYGSGYYTKPRFEGGVGVSCHQRIIEGLGLKMKHISDTKWTDVWQITK